MSKEIWYVEFPTYKYKEDVKELAQRNNLKIVDAIFQGKNKQCEKAPKLTLIDEVKEDKKTLLEQYNEDKNVVDTFNEKQLKSICKSLDIQFTTVEEIKEHLKTLEPLV